MHNHFQRGPTIVGICIALFLLLFLVVPVIKVVFVAFQDPATGELFVAGFSMPQIPGPDTVPDPNAEPFFEARLARIMPMQVDSVVASRFSDEHLALPISAVWIASVRPGDLDEDGDVDLSDYIWFQSCFTGSAGETSASCGAADLDGDGDVDLADFVVLQNSLMALP